MSMMKDIHRLPANGFVVVLGLAFAPVMAAAQSHPIPSPDLAAFHRYVAQAARDWRVPGLAIAIVKDDSLVFARGFGVLDIRKQTAVNEHTRFAVGSTTKAMTAAALGMLVDEGKVRWDDRVIDYVPEFRLYDAYATRETTLRDLVTHRTGLPGTDMLWLLEPYSMPEMIRRLRYIQPTASFRAQMQYQNVVYAVAGTVIERVSGMSWEAFIRSRIFGPLQMGESEPLVAGVDTKPNVAVPHSMTDDSIRVMPIRTTDPVASAGSIWSSVSDMSKWMRFMLDSGRVGTRRLITPATYTELMAPQIRAPLSMYPMLTLAKPRTFSYALGWFVQEYQGRTIYMHTGSIDGMSAIIGLMPDRRMGVFVLANLDHSELRHALMYQAFDLYNGNPTRDWSTDVRTFLTAPRRTATAADSSTNARPAPTFPLARYAGTYADSAYGTVVITFADGALRARFRERELGPLTHFQFETFRAKGPPPEELQSVLTFLHDGAGNVTGVRALGLGFARVRR